MKLPSDYGDKASVWAVWAEVIVPTFCTAMRARLRLQSLQKIAMSNKATWENTPNVEQSLGPSMFPLSSFQPGSTQSSNKRTPG